jgi:hypothetical protein
MDYNLFINNFIENINNLNHRDFNKNNFEYIVKIREKKEFNENPMILREYKSNMAKSIKNKVKNDDFIDINNINNNVDLFDANNINIFNTKEIEENKNNFYDLDKENKLEYIKDYMSRKKIYIEITNFSKIDDIIEDNELLKKYITISKQHNQISRISFFKKREDGSHFIDLIIPKKKSKLVFFK